MRGQLRRPEGQVPGPDRRRAAEDTAILKGVLLLLAALAGPARAQDLYPLGLEYEWTYLAFEDMGSRGLGFSHKLTRKVIGTRLGPGGTFYWVRESVADPDVGPSAGSRYATDLLKLPFKPGRVVADEILFRDASSVYSKARVEPSFKGNEDFERQCSAFEADKEPNRLRTGTLLPLRPAQDAAWAGPGDSKAKVVRRSAWTTEAMRRDWPDTVVVEEEGSGRAVKTFYAPDVGPVGWFLSTGKVKSYYELADYRFGAPKPVEITPEIHEMRLRGILGPDQDQYRPEDLKLLAEMRQAEQERGIEFLRAKAGTLGPYVVENNPKSANIQVWFNVKGFEMFRFYMSQQAILDFEQLGIELKYVFYLVDDRERPLFDEEGLLTDEGVAATYAMRRGDNAVWKLPGQDLSAAKKGGDDAKALALLAKGYDEVSEKELQFVRDATKCSQAQLEEQYTLKVVVDKKAKRKRYFVHKSDSLMEYVGLAAGGKKTRSMMSELDPLCQ